MSNYVELINNVSVIVVLKYCILVECLFGSEHNILVFLTLS